MSGLYKQLKDDLGYLQLGRAAENDRWCQRCGCAGKVRDSVTRRLAHEPFGWRPTILVVSLRRDGCTGCGHVWRQDLAAAALANSASFNASITAGPHRAVIFNNVVGWGTGVSSGIRQNRRHTIESDTSAHNVSNPNR